MIAKQYSIALPADYDMGIIRRRVAERGARFDSFPGLYLKAFLIRERGRAGAVGNEYAPFYLWPETEALWDFVAGDGFRAIIDGFGRPAIRNWLTLGVETRARLRPTAVLAATRSETELAPAHDLIALRRDEIDALLDLAVGGCKRLRSPRARWRSISSGGGSCISRSGPGQSTICRSCSAGTISRCCACRRRGWQRSPCFRRHIKWNIQIFRIIPRKTCPGPLLSSSSVTSVRFRIRLSENRSRLAAMAGVRSC